MNATDCRSIKFQISFNYSSETYNETTGLCTLSNTNRHLTPTAYRASTYDDYYLENQCVVDAVSKAAADNGYCTYEEYEEVAFRHQDALYRNLTKNQCQKNCDVFVDFNCRGFTFYQRLKKCILHSEDTKLRGPRVLVAEQGATYYEKARCLNSKNKYNFYYYYWKSVYMR